MRGIWWLGSAAARLLWGGCGRGLLAAAAGGVALAGSCPDGGDFKHPDICWDSGVVGGRQSRRFLESVEDNFLVQVIDGPTRGEALLDLVLTNAEESIREVKIGGSLGCSDHALVEFVILKNAGLAKSRARTLCFRRANFRRSRNC